MKRWLERIILAAAVIGLIWLLGVWLPGVANGGDAVPPPDATTASASTASFAPSTQPSLAAGHDARYWHAAYQAEHRRALSLKRTLLARPTVTEALNLACTVYGNCATLWRRAKCETGGTFDPRSANKHSSARGLLQFLTTGPVRRFGDHRLVDGGTWATTPFLNFSVYSPYANALAAGWMLTHGRGGEWSCR